MVALNLSDGLLHDTSGVMYLLFVRLEMSYL